MELAVLLGWVSFSPMRILQLSDLTDVRMQLNRLLKNQLRTRNLVA